MNFDFATASRIVFGCGRIRELPSITREFGTSVLLLTGVGGERWGAVVRDLERGGLIVSTHRIGREPTIDDAMEGAEAAREAGAEVILGVGGGSVLDAAKAVAALARNPGDPLEFLEVIGRAQPLRVDPLPVIAVPTTAGTGAEVTRNAVLGSPVHGVKVSLRHARLLPRVALVDPELAVGLPRNWTVSTGLDALTQLIEPWLSVRANPMTEGFCRVGLERATRSLCRVADDGANLAAREDMAIASLMGGLALANSGLGVVHGLAGPIGGMFDAPHGAVCAALLVPGLRVNWKAIQERLPGSTAESRFRELGRILTGNREAGAVEAIDCVEGWIRWLGVPGLAAYGIQPSDFGRIAAKGMQSSSLKGNPLPLTEEELVAVLEQASFTDRLI
jgi:alcohol dehydrogenase class IV